MMKKICNLLLIILVTSLLVPTRVSAQENCLAKFVTAYKKIQKKVVNNQLILSNIDERLVKNPIFVVDVSTINPDGHVETQPKKVLNQSTVTIDLPEGYYSLIYAIRFNYAGNDPNDVLYEVPTYIVQSGLSSCGGEEEIRSQLTQTIVFRTWTIGQTGMPLDSYELPNSSVDTSNWKIARYSDIPSAGYWFATLRNKIAYRNFFGELDSYDGNNIVKTLKDEKQVLQCTEDQMKINTKSYVKQKLMASYTGENDGKDGKRGHADLYCMEVLSISYNRPIALTAGLGFAYDIKVETKAQCEIANLELPTAPPIVPPQAVCQGSTGDIPTAGPNDSFDNCVNSCDGGKYTQSCINSCYQKVYSRNIGQALLTYGNKKIQPTRIDSEYRNGVTVTYDWENPQMQASFEANPDRYLDYMAFACARYNDCNYNDHVDGFPRAVNSDGSVCQQICHWETGGSGTVSTAQEAQEILNKRIKNLKAWVESQADYVMNEKEGDSEYKATITNNTTDKKTNNTTELKTRIKYSERVNEVKTGTGSIAVSDITYQFPQAYREQTSGRVEYKSIASSKVPFKDRLVYGGHNFYTALNSLTTNEEWWGWRTQFDQGNVDASKVPNAKDPDNIDTTLTNLGFFSWGFDVNCFYALSGPGFYNNGLNFVFRPIDLTNVHHGRAPRWNWSESAKKLAGPSNEAELKISKKPYIIDPIALTKDIQKKNYNIYDMGDNTGETPDYTLDLTASTMRKIRSYNASKKQNYLDKDLNCDKRTETGILICKSKFLDDSGFVTRDTAQIGCNNYDPYSKQCAMIME